LDSVFLNHQLEFISLCDSFNEDATIPIFVHPFNSSLLNSIAFDVPFQSNPKVVAIFSLSFFVVDYFKLMSFASHATFELKEVNYNTFHIKNVPCIPSTFDGDVLFELPPINNPNGHFGQMQGMDRKHDDHFWCKVKTTS
jgi:hypothetical protein